MNSPSWIPVGALGAAFQHDNHCLPVVADLAGRTFTLYFENGWVIRHDFHDHQNLTWDMTAPDGEHVIGRDQYRATRIRDQIYFVDFIKSSERATTVSLVLNLAEQVFVAVQGQLPDQTERLLPIPTRIAEGKALTPVSATFLRGSIDQPVTADMPLPAVTSELIGKRIEYRYSPLEVYEHIYLNPMSYTWHCIKGAELGLADTDACYYYRISTDLYLFVWCEKIIPTLGVIMIDLTALKTTGKILGYESSESEALHNFAVGAHARIRSVVVKDE